MRSFEDLECWKKAAALRRKISALVKTFPKDERFRLSDQIVGASRSVTANIAEGYGRYHYQENIQFCRQSRGSLFEIIDHLTVARDENYVSEDAYQQLRTEVNECLAMLNGFINYLSKAKSASTDVNEPEVEYRFSPPVNYYPLTDN